MVQQSALEFRTWVPAVCVGEHISDFIPAFPVILSVFPHCVSANTFWCRR
jgi:hypothetical protein